MQNTRPVSPRRVQHRTKVACRPHWQLHITTAWTQQSRSSSPPAAHIDPVLVHSCWRHPRPPQKLMAHSCPLPLRQGRLASCWECPPTLKRPTPRQSRTASWSSKPPWARCEKHSYSQLCSSSTPSTSPRSGRPGCIPGRRYYGLRLAMLVCLLAHVRHTMSTCRSRGSGWCLGPRPQ
jgi:hypothetical protein